MSAILGTPDWQVYTRVDGEILLITSGSKPLRGLVFCGADEGDESTPEILNVMTKYLF